MANNLQVISDTLRSPQTLRRVALAIGETDSEQTQAKRYAASVLAELEKMALDSKKSQILNCSPQSIAQTMIDAAKFRLMIDGRQHAHIVQYGSNATLQLGYRAYLFKVKEAYPDADITVRPIYHGEIVHIKDDNGFQTYTVESEVDPFDTKEEMLKGVLVAVTYTDGGRQVSKAMPILKSRIDRAKNAAKQDFIWKSDYIEKAKAAAIKAAFKIMFTQIQAMQEMIDFDNKAHFDVDRPRIEDKSGSIIDNLNQSLAETLKQINNITEEVIDQEESESEAYVPPPTAKNTM
jgi:recombinational DNA repair protein RecT